MTVQAGFVFGALISAVLNLADRIPPQRFMAASALVASVLNAAIALPLNDYGSAFLLRFLTGATLAGVYPPGMKLIATWCKEDRGLGIGVLIGALTLGSAMPHLLNGIPIQGEFGMPPWRSVLLATSAMGMAARAHRGLLRESGPSFGSDRSFRLALCRPCFGPQTHAACKFRLSGPHVGTVCNVDLGSAFPALQL